jgi:hypothetical protein
MARYFGVPLRNGLPIGLGSSIGLGGAGGPPAPIPDEYFEYTTLLLPGNGTNGAQNNTFLDSSTNNFTITRNGNTTQGTFSPFSQTGWGNYFDGTNSKVTMASNAAMSLTGQFTIECWVYWNGTTLSYQNFIGSNDTFSSNASFFRVWGTGVATLGSKVGIGNPTHDGTSSVYSSTSLAPNQWYHVAATRDSSNIIRVFVNGNLERTGSTDTSTYDFGQGGTCIGDSPWDGAQGWYSGYISNLRVLKGTCLYTTSFTPPTAALTNISNTSLLTCQSNRFIDNSSNAFSLTPAGNASIQAFSPFNPTAAWSAATNGGSGYFDGSGDYLTVASNAAFGYGTGDFTIECWFYLNALPSGVNGSYIIDQRTTATQVAIAAYIYSDATIVLYVNGGVAASGGTVVANQWNHFAICRSATTTKMFLNGTQIGSNYSDSNNYGTLPVAIASRYNGQDYVNGYISNFRIVKGTAVYTAAFTPPTAPLTAITNTSLLLNFTNAGIYDATSKNDLETVGNAQISTTQSKFGGSSMYFDGTGDGLLAPSTSRAIQFGTGAYTVEFWLYMNSVSGNQGLVTSAGGSGTGPIMALRSGKLTSGIFGSADTITSTTTLSTGQWYHVAYVRDSTGSNATRIYLNGVLDATGTISTDFSTAQGVAVGYTPTASEPANCYIDDLRITRGVARYTTGFTPPTTAFPVF